MGKMLIRAIFRKKDKIHERFFMPEMTGDEWNVPESHPRYRSLMTRERLIDGFRKGMVAEAGLIAHGRGEALDYLMGEETRDFALEAIKATAAAMKLASKPVISVNGNVAALVPGEIVALARTTGARIEVNLFYRTEERVKRIVEHIEAHGGRDVLGLEPDARIQGLDHARALCTKDGIYSADFVLVPLEDGDRTQALVNMGKRVATIDLNPLSRSAQCASITIVDNIVRAVPRIIEEFQGMGQKDAKAIISRYRNNDTLKKALNFMGRYLTEYFEG